MWVYFLLVVPWFATVSQIVRILRTKHSKDISIWSLVIWLMYHTAWTVYNLSTASIAPVYLVNSSSQLLVTLVLLGVTLYYRAR